MKKGLASFEFLIILGLVLLVTASVLSAAFNESRETAVQSATRSTVSNLLTTREIQEPGCIDPIITEYNVQNGQIMIKIEPEACHPTATEVADTIEKEICGQTPSGNRYITCIGETYEVIIQ